MAGLTVECTPKFDGTGTFSLDGAIAKSNLVNCVVSDAWGNTTNAAWNILVNRRVKVEWQSPLSGDNLCFVSDADSGPVTTINAGDVLHNIVKLYDLNDTDVTSDYALGVVNITFVLRNQDSPASSSVISTNVPVVPKAAKLQPLYIGKAGTALKPIGTMVYVGGPTNAFVFDCNTMATNLVVGAAWTTNTVSDTKFIRATVTVIPPKPFCTKSVVGTGALRIETN